MHAEWTPCNSLCTVMHFFYCTRNSAPYCCMHELKNYNPAHGRHASHLCIAEKVNCHNYYTVYTSDAVVSFIKLLRCACGMNHFFNDSKKIIVIDWTCSIHILVLCTTGTRNWILLFICCTLLRWLKCSGITASESSSVASLWCVLSILVFSPHREFRLCSSMLLVSSTVSGTVSVYFWSEVPLSLLGLYPERWDARERFFYKQRNNLSEQRRISFDIHFQRFKI